MKYTFIISILLAMVSETGFTTSGQTYLQEIGLGRRLPPGFTNSVNSIRVVSGIPTVGTSNGVFRLIGGQWIPVKGFTGKPSVVLPAMGYGVLSVVNGALYRIRGDHQEKVANLPGGIGNVHGIRAAYSGNRLYLAIHKGLYRLERNELQAVRELGAAIGEPYRIRDIAASGEGKLAVASDAGLIEMDTGGNWVRLFPDDGKKRWAPADLRAVLYDAGGRLWFAASQGAGYRDDRGWRLFTGAEGLPFDDFTALSVDGNGGVWFGTTRGAVRFNKGVWEYRQGPRWLPDDRINAIAADGKGTTWFATEKGVGAIRRIPMTLGEKARRFGDSLEQKHKRTRWGFVYDVLMEGDGDQARARNLASDNDGLWTAMYGASQCFAYAATGNEVFRERARKAFEALRFLGDVTRGGSHPAPPGFPARTVVPAGMKDPNEGRLEKDKKKRENRDRSWKLITPRWPKSADGKWYWKCDTSSDELDGHFFFYSLYYDLVAKTVDEKAAVRKVVERITDHLIDNGFSLVDHDGNPTRWARFGPTELNRNPWWWDERGLNSLSILSYLKVAEHVSGRPVYAKTARDLIENHGYAMNVMYPKDQTGPGTGNQSDDEMAFMNFYNLMKYETDPGRRGIYAFSFYRYHLLERPELNPLFNFMYAASCTGEKWSDPWGTFDLSPKGAWKEESVDTLRRFPMDRGNHSLINSKRGDIVFLVSPEGEPAGKRGFRRNGKVLPIDERHVRHWNHDPWQLDHEGDGRKVTDGAAFLLPYYMGLYHGFIDD